MAEPFTPQVIQAKLQTYLDSISSFSAKTVDGSNDLPEVATSIQEILNVRYKLVKNLKQVVEDSYKKQTKDTTASVVNCCKHNAGSETEGENGFPFPVDYNKMCHFRPPSDNKPPAKLPNTDHLMKTFKENAVGLFIATWQPWFTFIGVERREIMIVIDTSAVMNAKVLGKKSHLDIAKEVAKTVILYTSDKDRVAVIKSQGDKGYLEDENKCFSRELALVTKKYYEDVKKHIGGLQAGGRSTYMDGLKLAKSLLEQGNKKNSEFLPAL
ncbi:hypothetical protein LSAT2_033039 [Lamellibrachia satsuma]|nr:hypothetical protein LSAT2_033039 [Lamellibrachia satsuma]